MFRHHPGVKIPPPAVTHLFTEDDGDPWQNGEPVRIQVQNGEHVRVQEPADIGTMARDLPVRKKSNGTFWA